MKTALYNKVTQIISSSIRQAREGAGLTRAEVADGAGVSEPFIHKLEKGTAVSLKQICSVAEFMGLTENELFIARIDNEDSLDEQILEEVLS